MAYDPRLGRQAWKQTRRYVLERDLWVCQVRGPKCAGGATCVDHIVARIDGGDVWDPTNCRAACRPCNAAGGAKLTNQRRRPYCPDPDAHADRAPADLGPFRIF